MATPTVGFRFVKCPKCKKILAEFANVPVYQCGGCDTTLRSKIYNASRESIAVVSQDMNIPDSGSFDSALPSFKNELESADGVQNTEAPSQQSSDLDDSNNCCKEIPELDEENIIEVRDIISESPTRPSDERNAMNIMVDNDSECNGNSPELCQEKSLRSSEQTQEFAESTTCHEAVSSVEIETNRACHDGNESILVGSTTVKSNSYDGSVSSGDDPIIVRRRIGVSRRTFRQRKVQNSVENNEQTLSAETQVQNLEVVQEPSSEQVFRIVPNANDFAAKSDLANKCDSYDNELPAENKSHKKKNSSFNSEDFHSVQNWSIPENDETLNLISEDADFKHKSSPYSQIGSSTDGYDSHENIQMEILRKVYELREEIGELFDKPDEGKGRTHLNCIQEQRPFMKLDSNLTRLPLQHSYCKHCHLEDYQKHAKACRGYHHDIFSPMMHMSSTHLQCCHKPRAEHEVEQPNRERKQQIKQHCRPILGGAPFVICYNCFKLLQLPIDFFVAIKRMHKLRCGSCSKVLMFSFRTSNQRVPNEVEHSTSEMERSTYANIRNMMYNSQPNIRSQTESTTFSEEFADILAMRRYADTDESPISVQKQNGRLGTGLQLHKLMGYGSASELLYRQSFVDEDFDTTASATPYYNDPETI